MSRILTITVTPTKCNNGLLRTPHPGAMGIVDFLARNPYIQNTANKGGVLWIFLQRKFLWKRYGMLEFRNTSWDRYLMVTRPIIWLITCWFLFLTLAFIICTGWIFAKIGIPICPWKTLLFSGFIAFAILMTGKSADKTFRAIALSNQSMERRKFEDEKYRLIAKKETPWAVDWSDEKWFFYLTLYLLLPPRGGFFLLFSPESSTIKDSYKD